MKFKICDFILYYAEKMKLKYDMNVKKYTQNRLQHVVFFVFCIANSIYSKFVQKRSMFVRFIKWPTETRSEFWITHCCVCWNNTDGFFDEIWWISPPMSNFIKINNILLFWWVFNRFIMVNGNKCGIWQCNAFIFVQSGFLQC